jgi:hypothetical protein
VLDLSYSRKSQSDMIDSSLLDKALGFITIQEVPIDVNRFGTVPVDPKAAETAGVILIGVDANLEELEKIGAEISSKHSDVYLLNFIDNLQSQILQEILRT